MNESQLNAALRRADPATNNDVSPSRSADDLFREITESHTDAGTPQEPVDRESLANLRRWRPRFLLSAAAAVAVIAVVGVVAIDGSSGSPTAFALVTQAAQDSAAFESGQVTVVMQLDQIPGETTSSTMTFDHTYDGDDFDLVVSMTSTDDDPVAEDFGRLEFRAVGDEMYTSLSPDEFFVGERDDESIESIAGFNVQNVEPANVIALLEQTENFVRTSSDDGPAVGYRGSVASSDLGQLGADSLPAGLDLLASDGAGQDLPEFISLEVVVDNGLLDTIIIGIDGETPNGLIDATITIDFSALGEDQGIARPTGDQLIDASILFED